MKTFIVLRPGITRDVKDSGSGTVAGIETGFDLVFEAHDFLVDRNGALLFYTITKQGRRDLISCLAPGTWAEVHDATDCAAW